MMLLPETFPAFDASDQVDGALLRLPLLGFLPTSDPLVSRTIEKIEERKHVSVDRNARTYIFLQHTCLQMQVIGW